MSELTDKIAALERENAELKNDSLQFSRNIELQKTVDLRVQELAHQDSQIFHLERNLSAAEKKLAASTELYQRQVEHNHELEKRLEEAKWLLDDLSERSKNQESYEWMRRYTTLKVSLPKSTEQSEKDRVEICDRSGECRNSKIIGCCAVCGLTTEKDADREKVRFDIPGPMGNDGKRFPFTFDAMAWAKAFCARFPQMKEDVMVGWFANAIMRGWDDAHWKIEKNEGYRRVAGKEQK